MSTLARIGATLVVAALCLPATSHAKESAPAEQQSVDSLIRELALPDWSRVHSAKSSLESLQAAAIPSLLNMMNDRRRVPLTETGDLIYPGATTYYGHGFIVDFDLDSLPVRAGWVLEEITFQDFGFRAGQIDEDTLLRDTMKHGFKDRPLSSAVALRPARAEEIDRAVAAATGWWNAAANEWSRLRAIQQALSSDNSRRQMAAFQFLRFGKTDCAALNVDSYSSQLLPLVRKLADAGSDQVKQQAAYLLRDGWEAH